MSTLKKITGVIAFCLIIIVIAGAYSAEGKPDLTGECGSSGCHDTHTMTISSNATGTVNAKVGIAFSLVVNAASLDSGAKSGDMAVTVLSGWADNSQFLFTDQSIIDDETGDSNANIAEMTVTFTFTPQAIGTWTIRIWTAAKGDLAQSHDVSVSVTLSDSTPPSIDSPIDMTISEGDTTKNITWSPSDANPSSFEIFDDSVSWQSGPWDGSQITVMLNTLPLGTHNITLTVWDAVGYSASDQVNVTVVDGTDPLLDSPADIAYDEGATGYTITWDPTDSHPTSYIIYQEEIPVKVGTWNNSIETISISVDSLSIGTYNYTILVTDAGSNTATDIVWVTVSDGTPPIVDNPADVSYDEESTGYSISWTPSDLHPVSYIIYKDAVPVKSGSWNSSAESITISVDGLTVGSYSYILEVTDIGSNTATDTVVVIVSDGTAPTIDSPTDILYNEGATGSFRLESQKLYNL